MIPFDLDLISFAFTTANVLFASKSALRKNSRQIPVRYERQFFDDSQLTQAQRNYIAPYDKQLAALGYRPFYTLSVTNFGSNLVRGYLNPAEPVTGILTIVEVRSKVRSVAAVRNVATFSFNTRFANGKDLVTRNMPIAAVMDPPPYKIVQECINVTDLSQLKRIHDAKVPSAGVPLPPPNTIPDVVADFDKDHSRVCAFQVEQGAYALSSDGNSYLLTDKIFNRGIRNFFNPFTKRLSITIILFSILVGAFLPLLGILRLAPMVAAFDRPHAHVLFQPTTLVLLACYALAGMLLGLFADSQNYVWVMAITYIPAHIVAGWSFGMFPYSTTAFLVSYYVKQAVRKRRLILQT